VIDFSGNWTGDGAISGSGDAEIMCLYSGQYMESNVVYTGYETQIIAQNSYDISGDTLTIRYRHGNSAANCLLAVYSDYTVPFVSLGYVQVRVEYP